MELKEALAICKETSEGLRRWGVKNYQTGHYTPSQVLEALQVMYEERDKAVMSIQSADREEITKLRKELSLSKAREGRASKRYETLKNKAEDTAARLEQLQRSV